MVAPMTDILTVRFLAACKNGNLDSAKRNVDNAEINTKGEGNNTGLMLASAGGKVQVVKFLLTLDGLDVNVTNTDGRSALMLAANKKHVSIVKMLVEREDTNVEQEDKWKMTAEDLATIRNYTEIVNLIKEAKKKRDDNFFRVYEDLPPEDDARGSVEEEPVYGVVSKINNQPTANEDEPDNERDNIPLGDGTQKESLDLIDLNTEVKSNVESHKYDNIVLISSPIPAKRAMVPLTVRPASISVSSHSKHTSPTSPSTRPVSMCSSPTSRPVSMSLDLLATPPSPTPRRKKSRCRSLKPGMIPENSKSESLLVNMDDGSSDGNKEGRKDNGALGTAFGSSSRKKSQSRSRSISPQPVPSLVDLCTPVAEKSTAEDETLLGRWLTRVLSGDREEIQDENKSEKPKKRKKRSKERPQSVRVAVTKVTTVNELEVKDINLDDINEDLSSKTRENILKKINEVNLLLSKAEREYVPSKVVEMKQKKEITECMAVATTERKQLASRQANEKKQFERKQKLEKNELYSNQKENIDKIKEKYKNEIEKAKMQEEKINQYQDMIGAMTEKLSQLDNQVVIKNKSSKAGRSISELECPVCLEEMRPPIRIWQCKDGHALCDNCKQNPRIKKCPTCRGPFMGRATILEKVAHSIFSAE